MSDATDRNVYLLGAGFSATAGAPLIYDFLERSRAFINNPPTTLTAHGMDQFRRVFAFKDEIAKAREKIAVDLDNLEELFGVVEMSFRLGTAPVEIRNSMIYVIAKTLELCTTPRRQRGNIGFVMNATRVTSSPLSDLNAVAIDARSREIGTLECKADLYDFFALLLAGAIDLPAARENRSDIAITFNYDLILDDAIRRLHLTPWYAHDLSATPPDNSITLLKLHGSANWAICPRCSRPAVYTEKLSQSFSELDAIPCTTCGEKTSHPLLIPPSWDKTDHRAVMQPVWSAAVNELRRATRICIIGYSIPKSDAFFRYLLTVALADNRHLERLIVVDYCPRSANYSESQESVQTSSDSVERRWLELLDPTFAQASVHISPLRILRMAYELCSAGYEPGRRRTHDGQIRGIIINRRRFHFPKQKSVIHRLDARQVV